MVSSSPTSCGCSSNPKVTYSNQYIPQDILILIFIYLPVYSIYKLRCVSKLWLSILSSPTFIQQWVHFNNTNKSILWMQGITVFNLEKVKNALKRKFKIAYPPHVHPISRYLYGFSFRFLNSSLGVHGRELWILGSSNGLILCCVPNTTYTMSTYYVCNPLTQKWVSLPASPHEIGDTSFFCDHTSTGCCFKVVSIPSFERSKEEFEFQIFSSELGEWEVVKVYCTEYVHHGYSYYSCRLVHNNVLYWIEGKNRLLVCNLNNNDTGYYQSSLINLPAKDLLIGTPELDIFKSQFLGESEGLICYARISGSHATLSVWVLEENKWQVLHKDVKLQDIFADIESRISSQSYSVEQIRVIGFSPTNRNVVLLGCMNYMWGFDVQTRVFEELFYPSFLADTHLDDSKGYFRKPFLLKVMPSALPSPSWIYTSAA